MTQPNPEDRAAWFLAALLLLVFGWLEIDELALELAITSPLATA